MGNSSDLIAQFSHRQAQSKRLCYKPPMNDKTQPHEKDAAQDDSIAALRSRLENLGFNIVESLWLNPVPNVWSVKIHDADCPLCSTNGKGASKEAALESALGEYLERLACNYFFANYYMGLPDPEVGFYHSPQERWFPLNQGWPKGLIDDQELQAFYNPEGSLTPAHLIDSNSGDRARGICALPYTRVSDGETQWFPVNLINNLYDSNGMSAGKSREETRVQALSEVLERYIKFHVISEGLALPDVPEEILQRYPTILAGIQALRDAGYGVLVRDASLNGQYPVMSVTLLNAENGGCLSSFGAHPRFEVALERTLTELLQGRELDQLGTFSQPSFDQDLSASYENIEQHFVDGNGVMPWRFFSDSSDFEFVDWNFAAPTRAEEYAWICEVFEKDDLEIYFTDHEQLGFYACHALVPGLSEIYPADDLEWDNDNIASPWRETLFNLHSAEEEQLQALADWLDEQNFAEQQSVAELFGLAPDPGSPWEALRIGHLNLWLALALQQTENISDQCQWAINFGEANGIDIRLYRCIALLDGFDDEDYAVEQFGTSLSALYPAELLRLARSLYDGSIKFPGLHDPSMALNDMKLHQSLIAAFGKLRAAMNAKGVTPEEVREGAIS